MLIKVREGFNIEPILRKLSKSRTINADGSATHAHFGSLDVFESYLKTALYAEGKSNAFVSRVIKKAIFAEQNLDKHKFLRIASKIGNRLDQMERKKLKVVFPIFGGRGLLSGSRQWRNIRMSFDVSLNSSFMRRALSERERQFEKRRKEAIFSGGNFSELPFAVCTVQAIDVFDAFELAEKAISVELGLHSLAESRGQVILTSSLSSKPICRLLLAPHMTVHDPNGAIFQDIFWYNAWPDDFSEAERSEVDVAKIQDAVSYVRKRMRHLERSWREKAEMALARHYEAFSQKDLESCFLDGWRLLESIGGHSREKGERLVKRAAWFFENPDEQTQFGLHLLQRRNLISHGRPVKGNDDEGLAFQMRSFLTPMLHAFLTNPFNLKDLDEFWAFCDLPVNRVTRERQRFLLECSTRFRLET